MAWNLGRARGALSTAAVVIGGSTLWMSLQAGDLSAWTLGGVVLGVAGLAGAAAE